MARVLVWGATGQARVLRPIIEAGGDQIVAVVDRDASLDTPFGGIPLIEPGQVEEWADRADSFVVAIGGMHGRDRVECAERLAALGLRPLTVRHETSWVAASAEILDGAQICGLAGVSEEAVIGPHTIVNTGATVDHECTIGSGVHVMPGATVTGLVTIEDYASVGSNATVLPRLTIGEGARIGAGAVVTTDVPADAVVMAPKPI